MLESDDEPAVLARLPDQSASLRRGLRVTAIYEFAGNQRFEVLKHLGQGGMGSVYQVMDRSRNVRLAMKSVGRVSGDTLLRFKREYRALQEIRHRNLVELGDLFELDQSWFFTMELIDGVDFYSYVRADAVRRSDIPPTLHDTELDHAAVVQDRDAAANAQRPISGHPIAPRSAGFAEERLRRGLAGLVSGVAALHAHGLVHRDLKPANVLVTQDGRVVLIDFGLVTGLDRNAQSTEVHVVGTFAYMSPEQAKGESIGPASDWYAIGVLLYECLTGCLPFQGSHLHVLLRKQVEVPPSPRSLVAEVPADLDALCMALLEIDPRKRPSVQEIYRRLHVDAQTSDQRPSTSLSVTGLPEVFVGRARELERLSHAFASPLHGQQCCVRVVGPSGVGKSALLRRFHAVLSATTENTLVLRGQCHERETVPYKALDGVMDALSKWLKEQPNELAEMLLPADTPLIAATFPVLERVLAVRNACWKGRVAKDPQEKRAALLLGVRELFRRLGQFRRVVLILEDMQWSDDDSFHLLRELTRTPDAPPLLIIYSRQPGLSEQQGNLQRMDPGTSEELLLSPLDLQEGLELLRRIGPGRSESALRRIVDQAEGYPFLLEALVQASSGGELDDGKEAVENALKRLFESLAAPSRALLEVTSLAGFPLEKRLAAQVAGIKPEDLSSELRLLRATRWIRTGGPLITDLVEPSHDRVRHTVLAELAADRRTVLHRALARALDEARAEPDKIAHHYLLAGDRRKAAQHLRAAADRAHAALAFDRAAALLKELIELNAHERDEEKDLLIAWGEALASAGRCLDAAHAYARAIPHCNGAEALDIKRRVAEQYLLSGRFDEGMTACSAFLDSFGVRLPATPRGRFFELLMLRARLGLRGMGFKIRQPDQVPPEELARIDALWSMAKGLALHEPIGSIVFQTRGILSALAAGEPYRVSRALALQYVDMVTQKPHQVQRAEQLLLRGTELASEAGSSHALALIHFCRGMGEYVGLCRWAQALDSFEQGLGILRSDCRDAAWEVSQSIQMAAHCRMYMGDWKTLREAKHDCQEAEARGDLFLGLVLRGNILSFLSLVDDRPDAAAQELEQAFRPIEETPSPIERFVREISNLRLLQYRGQAEQALTAAAAATHRKGLIESLLFTAPVFRLLWNESGLRNALLAAELNMERKTRLKQAAQLASKLERDGIGAAVPSSHLGRAAIAHASGQTERALMWLERAESGFAEHQRDADAAAARRRRGQLLGGENGAKLVLSAERWFTEQGTRNVPAMCRLLAPGFLGLDSGNSG